MINRGSDSISQTNVKGYGTGKMNGTLDIASQSTTYLAVGALWFGCHMLELKIVCTALLTAHT